MKAKFVICLLSLLCLMAWQGAAEPIYVENPSFEEPDLHAFDPVRKTHGWDEGDGAYYCDTDGETYGPVEVPGWESDGSVEDSGISYKGDNIRYLEDGDQYGYIMGDDPPVYQLTDHTIAAGEYYTLTFDAYNCYDGPEVTAFLYYSDPNSAKREREHVASCTVVDLEERADYAKYGTVIFAAYDDPNSIGKKIGIEFDNLLKDSDFTFGTWTAMDDVKLDVSLSYANDIYPLNGAENVLLDISLEWFLDEGHTGDLYFGTIDDPNLVLLLEDTSETIYDPYGSGPEGDLEYGTTYCWRIGTVDPNEGGTPVYLPGMIWTFTTITEGVVIITQPQGVTLEAGTDAEISVEALSVTDIEYQWYKVVEGSDPDPEEDFLIPGATSEVLTINDVQLENEGYYYCAMMNDNTEEPVLTDTARLMIRRLVGWWKLDGNLSDSVTDDISGVETHAGAVTGGNPDYVPGVDGMGVEFLADGRIISIQDSGEYFNFYPQGMTASIWIKTETNEDGVMAKQLLPDDGDPLGWYISVDAPDPVLPNTDPPDEDAPVGALFTVHPRDGLAGNSDTDTIFEGQWHLITAVIDPATRTSRIYVDGVVRNESKPFNNLGALETNQEPLVIGAENADSINAFHGVVDDIRIWNYPREELDIAQMYLDIEVDKDVCFNQEDEWLKVDFAGEPGEPSYCRIDIEDIAAFADAWLECRLLPTCVEL